MKNDVAAKMAKIFGEHREEKASLAATKDEKETREQFYIKEFASLREEVIRPTFDAFVEQIKDNGYSSDVRVEDDHFHATFKRSIPSSISLTVYVDGKTGSPRAEHPNLTLQLDRAKGSVIFIKSTSTPGRGGSSGPDGSYALADVNTDLIENKLIALLSAVFGRSPY